MVDADPSDHKARTTVEHINRAWLAGRLSDLEQYLHPDMVMVFPGFCGRVTGAQDFIAGFEDFVRYATVESFDTTDWQVHETRASAVVTFSFNMLYTRSGKVFRSTGRDLWVLSGVDDGWKAIWRTMLDLNEEPHARRDAVDQ